MTDAATAPAKAAPLLDLEERVSLLRRVGSLVRIGVAVLLCLTPLTAIIVMGWLMRAMARESAVALRQLEGPARRWPRPPLPNLLRASAPEAGGFWQRWTGGLAENIRLGLASVATIAAGTLPFTLLWLLSWWGGWENSFNKGYEQAWVGPVVGLIGVAVALPLLTHLPMAVAHQAAEGRMSAFFAIGHIRRLISHVRWRYTALCLMIVLAALPLFAVKGLPVFVENWSPGFLGRNAEEIERFAAGYRFWGTLYLVLAVIFLRRAAARLYARARFRLAAAGGEKRRGWRITPLFGTLVIWGIWFSLVAQIYVGQFLNHQWLAWVNPPVVGLPWIPLPGSVL